MSVLSADPPALDFDRSLMRLATTPPEARGLPRDGVRLLVASPHGLQHRRAYDLPDVLQPGVVLVVNTSATLPAALTGVDDAEEPVAVHLSTVRPGGLPTRALRAQSSLWVVELRDPTQTSSTPSDRPRTDDLIRLPDGASLRVLSSYPPGRPRSRLWLSALDTPRRLDGWLERHGQPIRYPYITGSWPIATYRTDIGDVPGSAEMPSAGRVLTRPVLARLAARGVKVAQLVLHCGVSSLETDEPPRPEWYSVPATTAETVNRARDEGRRVIAVGTTVVRALESATGLDGRVRGSSGWTDLIVTPERGVRTVDGLLTGWHEPRSSHLLMLQAVAGPGTGEEILYDSYRVALDAGYLWHEFGDVHLLLPSDKRIRDHL